MQLRIGDGTTWTDLAPTDGTLKLIDFDRVAARGSEDVTERASFSAITTAATAEAAILACQQWFEIARLRRRDISQPRVFLRIKAVGDSDWYRAEIRDGHAQSDTISQAAYGGVSSFSLAWTREPTLYAETEAQLGATTSLYNTYAGGVSNILNLGALASAARTPLRLSITNSNASSLATIYAALYSRRSAITTATLGAATTLEAESGTVIAGTGTSTADANMSNGNYRAFSWSATTETELLKWSLSATDLAYLGAKSWRVFLRVRAAPTLVSRLRMKLKYGTQTIDQTELVTFSGANLIELPAITLPPYEANAATLSALDLTLAAIGSTGTKLLDVDAVHLMPTDGFRVYTSSAGYLATTEILLDNPNAGVVHQSASSAVRSTMAALGRPLVVGAGDYHALFMLAVASDGTAAKTLNQSVSAYTQSRRRTAI